VWHRQVALLVILSLVLSLSSSAQSVTFSSEEANALEAALVAAQTELESSSLIIKEQSRKLQTLWLFSGGLVIGIVVATTSTLVLSLKH
jgi:hypothetical protein